MKNTTAISVTAASLLALGCGGSKEDPETESRASFAPPAMLQSMMTAEGTHLRWQAQAREGVQGYYVFAAVAGWEELKDLVAYPRDYAQRGAQSAAGVPYCKDNNAFFARFLIPPTDHSCESLVSGIKRAGEKFSSVSTSPASGAEAFASQALSCEGTQEGALSLAASDDAVARCRVDVVYREGMNALPPMVGETLTFVVFAARGESADEVSWSSNFVSDTVAFSSTHDLRLGAQRYSRFEIDVNGEGGLGWGISQEGDLACGNADHCRIGRINREEGPGTFYVSRDGATKYPGRLFVSAPEGGAMRMVNLGHKSQVKLYEAALSDFAQPNDGVTHSVQVPGLFHSFAFRLDQPGGRYFGKIVVESLSYGADDTERTGEAQVKVHVLLQPRAGVPHYFH